MWQPIDSLGKHERGFAGILRRAAQKTKNGAAHGLVGNTYTSSGIVSQASGNFEIETWTYDFGPNQLMERIRIENGIVVQIDSLGYGHDQP